MLSYLRAQLRKAEKCKLMKMVVVGPPRQGKSTLLEILQTGRATQAMHGEATIRTTKWELQRPAGSRAKVKDGQHAESPWVGGSFPGPLVPPLWGAQDSLRPPREFAGAPVCCSHPAPAKGSEFLSVTLQFFCKS